jgi:drug/metabolite transporter (DMT)-like permease
LILVAGLALALGGIGLGIAPGTLAWWLTRPIWILILGTVLLTLVPIFLRYERLRPLPPPSTTPTWRLLLGALLFCAGLAILTLNGITSDNWLGIRIVEFTLPFIGAVFVGILSTSKA